MSVTVKILEPIQYEILREIAASLSALGAPGGLLSAVSSWGDTLPEEDVLVMLKDWNAKYA